MESQDDEEQCANASRLQQNAALSHPFLLLRSKKSKNMNQENELKEHLLKENEQKIKRCPKKVKTLKVIPETEVPKKKNESQERSLENELQEQLKNIEVVKRRREQPKNVEIKQIPKKVALTKVEFKPVAKNEQEIVESQEQPENAEVKIKRGRGRPRKVNSTELELKSIEAVKKDPLKNKQKIVKSQEQPENTEVKIKRGRGRPKKINVESQEQPENAEVKIKQGRGRGRPRKVEVDSTESKLENSEVVKKDVFENKQEIVESQEQSENIEVNIKRGRGRPKKVESLNNVEVVPCKFKSGSKNTVVKSKVTKNDSLENEQKIESNDMPQLIKSLKACTCTKFS